MIRTEKLPITTGARDSHRVIGMDCPSMNWEAAALKKGSRAEKQTSFDFMSQISSSELNLVTEC